MKKRCIVLSGLLLWVIVYGIPCMLMGNAYTPEGAVRRLHTEGESTYRKKAGDHLLMLWDTGYSHEVMVVKRTWGLLYRLHMAGSLTEREPGAALRTTWSAQLTKEQKYDTILAAEAADPRIKKIIVTSEGPMKNITSVEAARSQSAVYVEMDVEQGFAAQYLLLSPADAGNFVFRGLDEAGNIVYAGW
ncbi:hypothetical protein ACP26L_12880 [Paenibacillus sp. S-38]|uniref:hypothetical protein n=1 Tax=Paenibacillus sp. S-38 TaxID=3416710 RepID=UPI003CEF8234